MQRRQFLAGTVATALLARAVRGHDLPSDLRITRIVGFDLLTRRSKFVGKNAIRGDHGDRSRDRMVLLETNVGQRAVGRCWRDEAVVAQLLGTNPFSGLQLEQREMPGPLAPRTMVLWDLAGKLLGKLVYELLGGENTSRVPVYDGSIYFSDLLPQHAHRWRDRFKEEIDMGLAAGHAAFKIKVGRGHKWMSRQEGDDRDVEVLEIIRRHTGPDVLLGVDANNGYDPAGAKRFLERTAAARLAFLEEPFPEVVEQCVDLKRFIAERGLNTLLADGEGQSELAVYQPFVDARALDVLQGDMNGFGVEGILAEAAMAQPQGILVAPHNWSSLTAFYLQLHMGLAIPNFFRAESDPLSSEVLVAEGYELQDGTASVSSAPGFGLEVDDSKFDQVKLNFELKA